MKPTLAFLHDNYSTLLYPHNLQAKPAALEKVLFSNKDEECVHVRLCASDLKHFSKIVDTISQERFIKICKSYAWLPELFLSKQFFMDHTLDHTDCGISTIRNIQNWSGQGPEQPTLPLKSVPSLPTSITFWFVRKKRQKKKLTDLEND